MGSSSPGDDSAVSVDRGRVHGISATTSCALGVSSIVNEALLIGFRPVPCSVHYCVSAKALGERMAEGDLRHLHLTCVVWKGASEVIVGNLQQDAKRPTVIVVVR